MYNTFHSSPSHANIASGNAEKKTRKWEGNADLLALLNGVIQSGTNRTIFIYDNVDIPQMINMLAARVVTGDMDCCHKNYYLYRDTTGTGEWQAFPWDVDLSFGRRWISSLTYWDDTMVINTDIPVGSNNGLFNALYTTPEISDMYWRRLRTLMDEILQPPGTPTNQLKFEKRINELTSIIAPDAALDLAKWGTWGNGSAQSTCCIQTQPQAADIIKNTYLPQKRTYLFNTMSVTSGGRIPLAQPANIRLNFGTIDFNPVSGNQNEEFIQITNANSFAVDISGWRLDGGIRHIFKPGTVIPSNGVLYVARDVKAFRARQVAPKGGMGLFVQGNYQGQLSARGEAIILLDKNGNFVNITSYTPSPSLAQQFLRITEIMYNPAPAESGGYVDEDFEYIELKNIGNAPIPLAGVRFINGIYFDFSTSTIKTLSPGEYILVVKNIDAFIARYGTNSSKIAGTYTGSLDNNGERILLIDASGEEILDFSYNDNWYKITDGLGFSLTIVNEFDEPDTWNNKSNWKSSVSVNGSPGSNETMPPQILPVIITEVLSRSDNPPPSDTIELHNPNDSAVDISGWYLTDDFNTPKKFRIPNGTIIPPNGFITFDESSFNQVPGLSPSFALSADGDEVYLFSADPNGNLTGYYSGFEFGGSENNITIGRHVTSDGKIHYVAQKIPTLGTNNTEPLVGPIVISEIMYNNPSDSTMTNFGTYIELANISSNTVNLRIPGTTNQWRLTDGIEFEFTTNITIQANARILVVDFDPVGEPEKLNKFCQKYNLPANAPIYGPFSGKLNNAEDTIRLEKPVFTKDGQVIYVIVDRVDYKDTTPWDSAADGIGFSLQKINLDKFGNEPTNWIAAIPTPTTGISNYQLPVITESPQSQIVFLQSNVVLTVKAIGDNLRYQWRLDGRNIDGATNSAYVITNAQLYHSGTYEVCVYNQAGGVSASPIAINIVIPAAILSQPKDVAVFPGETATFGVAVSSTSSVYYQWLKNGIPIPGATNIVLTVPSVTHEDDGYYSVLVTDRVGTVASAPAKLTVLLHPVFMLHPKTVNINPGGTATFTAQAISTTPVRYQWRFNGTDIPGATNTSITITNAQLEQAGIYTAVATDDNGPIESEPADLNVLVRPTIIKQPTPSNCVARVGEDVSFEIGASGLLPISYRWRQNATSITNIIIRGTNCVFTITNVQFSHAGYYDVAITNLAGQASSLSSRTYLTVYEPMTNIFVRPSSNATFNFNIKATAAATIPANVRLTYLWYFNETNPIPYGTTNFLTITNVTYEKQGPYTVVATNASGTIVTQTAMLIIREKPIIVKSPQSVTAKVGNTVEFSVIAEDAEPINYKWFFNGAEIPYLNQPKLILTNIQSTSAGQYYVVAWNNAGTDTSTVATLTIQSSGDSDNDGMPDDWEIANGLRPDVDDANEDKDGDGMSNIAEFIAGTNPSDKNSILKISSISIAPNNEVIIEFESVPDKDYQILVSTNFLDNWSVLTNILRTSTNKTIIKDSESANKKYYRIKVK
ncbi:MAG: lamin tail domain-containing protein [Verrucomicrobiae bacterium]|nr:lamin tail domain-containing protein [Verrucomicrobiae bacterium]